MARLKKDTADYFPHYAEASSGDTLTALQGQFGNDGYAFWFKLLEKLTASEGHYIDCRNSKRWQVLLGRANVAEGMGLEIMNLLAVMGAVDKELWEQHSIIWCQNLVDNLDDVYKKRKRESPQKPDPHLLAFPKLNPALNEEISGEETSISDTETPISTPENTQSKVKKSKVDNSRVEESTKTSEQVFKLFREKIGSPDDTTQKEIRMVIKNMSATWVYDAILEADKRGKGTWGYIYGILRNWRKNGKPTSTDRQ